ncbi:ATP-binding domain-containing protein [Actimicrobium antarcticum]|uniref:ATP-dependent helicase n=1 Tax=Actimicrobium antarcticum TaxID=1051899 RepID=A0ABP7TJX7_9BURK
MTNIVPSGWRELATTGAASREIATLTRFADGLDTDYLIFHGVHWTNIEDRYSVYGEIDFIVVAPNGRVLVIEQKSGFLTETDDGLIKRYPGRTEKVHLALIRTIGTLRSRFAQTGGTLDIDYLLYCPDYRVTQPALAGLDPTRIVDASNADRLIPVIRQLLPLSDATPQRAAVSRFFNDTLRLIPDPSAMVGRADALVTRLADGLATWARQIEFTPFRLRVIGTAGSGKTQLAMAEFRAAVAAGLHPLYVCYNRPLADHMRALLGPQGRVANFHMLCDAYGREAGSTPDYSNPNTWQSMETVFDHGDVPAHWQHDVVIIDEGQDFSEDWRDAVLKLVRAPGRVLWLEDPMQNLYGRAPVDLPDWVTLRVNTNYRNPREIVDLLDAITDGHAPAIAASPFVSAGLTQFTYADGDQDALLEATKEAVTHCLSAGFARNDIVLLSFKGREKSTILKLDHLGQHALHSFTGAYDLLGNPVFRKGGLLAESVYRFKGQSAPAVIFTEIDFQELDERTIRKLFVGMTRASLKLVLVASASATKVLTRFA